MPEIKETHKQKIMDIEQEYIILKNTLQRFNVDLIRDTDDDHRYGFEAKRSVIYRLHLVSGDIIIMKKSDGTFLYYNEYKGIDYKIIMDCFFKIRDRKNKINKILYETISH